MNISCPPGISVCLQGLCRISHAVKRAVRRQSPIDSDATDPEALDTSTGGRSVSHTRCAPPSVREEHLSDCLHRSTSHIQRTAAHTAA